MKIPHSLVNGYGVFTWWPFPDQKSQKRRLRTNQLHESKGKNLKLRATSICRELTGQTILVVTRISMHEGDGFSAKTLGKSLFHFQNDSSIHDLACQFWQMESALKLEVSGKTSFKNEKIWLASVVSLPCSLYFLIYKPQRKNRKCILE